jgi:hypothetical protein
MRYLKLNPVQRRIYRERKRVAHLVCKIQAQDPRICADEAQRRAWEIIRREDNGGKVDGKIPRPRKTRETPTEILLVGGPHDAETHPNERAPVLISRTKDLGESFGQLRSTYEYARGKYIFRSSTVIPAAQAGNKQPG